MKSFISVSLLASLLSMNPLVGETLQPAQDLLPPSPVTVAGEPLVVDGFAAPHFGDFDADGIYDLLVGQLDGARLRIYRNVGSNEKPHFESFEWFQVGGRIANVTTCCRAAFTPRLIDFDGDRDLDILTGSGQGSLYLFRRRADGEFSAAEVLIDSENQTVFTTSFGRQRRRYPYNSTVYPFDWDEDGDWDLIIGTRYGISRNVGTLVVPIFEPTRPLIADGKELTFGLAPCVADWDDDGLEDLLVGDIENIFWHRNEGSPGRPVFGKPQLLLTRKQDRKSKSAPNSFYAFDVADFNGDGKVDLLVGDTFTEKNVIFEPLTSDARAANRIASRQYSALSRKEFSSDVPHEDIIVHHHRLLKKSQQFYDLMSTRMVRKGRVWFYERMP